MTKCRYIDDYIAYLRGDPHRACAEILQWCDYVEKTLDDPHVVIDNAKIEKAIELIERYFKMTLFPWEKCVIALEHCYYDDDSLVFQTFLIMMGRGNGKNGFISGNIWYLTTKYHGIQGYNVDIIANSEDQAKTSFDDVYTMLEDTWSKSRQFFYKTKLLIENLNTRSYIKFNTSSAKTKDGKRSACLVFDEIHEYENSDRIKVFRSGFGKRKHSRTFYITTQGYVREGVLDDQLRIAHDVLNGKIQNSRMCPMLFKLDNREEAEDPQNWEKANPSLPYLPELKSTIEREMVEKDYDASVRSDLYTKRFNLPDMNEDIIVTDYENIKATNRELPDLTGWSCTVGFDYAEINDWAAVNFHFRRGDLRYDINHAWVCLKSKTLWKIKAPYREWAENGVVTLVDDVSISPDLVAEYINEAKAKYNIKALAMDGFRWTLVAESFRKIGFDPSDKNRLKLVRTSDIMKVEPVIQDCFQRSFFIWGDNPCLRWAVNNTKRVRSSKNIGSDTGNFYYAKIESKSRKTDPWMALVASMTIEDCLGNGMPVELPTIGAISL